MHDVMTASLKNVAKEKMVNNYVKFLRMFTFWI